jgi:monovalent cation:proton antiporter-2 (CPA2) family protein
VHGEDFIFQAFVYLAAAVVAVPIAKRMGLGSVLGYLLAGVVIGPFGFHLVGEEGRDVMQFAEFGVVMMLFLIGLELDPARLWRLRTAVLGLGGLQVGITAGALAVIILFLGLDWRAALAIGLMLALSSTAIVLQTLAEKGLMKTAAGQSSFAVLLFQDMAVIPLLALLPLLAPPGFRMGADSGHGGGHGGALWTDGLPGWAETLVVLAAVSMVVLIGRFLVRPLFRAIARTRLREMFTAAALLLVVGTSILMSRVGLSPALGAFLAGVVLANSEYRHELESDIQPFKGLLLGLFFIAVGASIDFDLIGSRPGTIVGLALVLVAVKGVILLALAKAFRLGLDQGLLFSLALAQGGEFAFVLSAFAGRNGILEPEVIDPLVAIVALSMAATPLLLLLGEKVLLPRVGTSEADERAADDLAEENPVIIAGFGRFGRIVGRLLRANGVETTVLDLDSDNVDVLRKLGFRVFYGDASRYELLEAAGAEKARLLVLALDSPEKTLELVETARKHFPHLTILARASGRTDTYDLLDAGVKKVYRETFDTALRMAVDALRMLGFRAYQAHRAARTFRRHDEENLSELAAMRHDRKQYINVSRQRIEDVEEILLADLHERPETVDAGWDTESLRQDYGGADGS